MGVDGCLNGSGSLWLQLEKLLWDNASCLCSRKRNKPEKSQRGAERIQTLQPARTTDCTQVGADLPLLCHHECNLRSRRTVWQQVRPWAGVQYYTKKVIDAPFPVWGRVCPPWVELGLQQQQHHCSPVRAASNPIYYDLLHLKPNCCCICSCIGNSPH